MVNQHSKRVTKPIFELQPHIALQQGFFQKGHFILKVRCHFKDNGPSNL